MTINLPGPAGMDSEPQGSQSQNEQQGNAKSRERNGFPIPGVEECLWKMSQMVAPLAFGVLKPAQANAMLSIFRQIMHYHQGSQSRQQQVFNGDLLELARQNPAILNLLEPFLTDDQIAMLMKEVEDEDGE